MNRVTKEQLQKMIDEQPFHSLAQLTNQVGLSRTALEKLLKNYKLVDYRNQKIKTLRRREKMQRQSQKKEGE
ncbi:hypothetical protein ACFO26_09570 [Lactococcus nasutitermitis]|uniref:Uncharacterized protein n=1 Tax=Lactococcus nasutitermitis TaxID=1652957 RepID=A0ABV9JI56_9LACT|nr:hypothetical protein [Lactococcus nasutitermitis]